MFVGVRVGVVHGSTDAAIMSLEAVTLISTLQLL